MDGHSLPPAALRGIAYSQWAYWCSLVVAALSVVYIPPGSIRTAVLLSPILTGVLCLSVAYWLYQASDEYIRVRVLLCVATTAIVMACCSLGYFFLELIGFPRVSMLWINLLGWSIFNLQVLYVMYRSR
jgi:hypothetical protein